MMNAFDKTTESVEESERISQFVPLVLDEMEKTREAVPVDLTHRMGLRLE